MPQSESVAKLNGALARAQVKFDKLKKDTTGQEGHLKFQYVQLPDVLNMVRPLLNAEGVYLNQPIIRGEDGNLRLTTKVQLEEEFMQSDGIPLPATTPGKELGKIITYARRIDLMPFLGITGEEDEDAPDLKPVLSVPASSIPQHIRKDLHNQAQAVRIPNAQSLSRDVIAQQGGTATMVRSTTKDGTEITDDDLPKFDTPIIHQPPMSVDMAEVADHLIHFVPLTQERNTEVQTRLKDLVSQKVLDRRKLSLFLEAQHKGAKSFEVSAETWEDTMKKIEEAVSGGTEAVKTLMKGEK